MEDFKFSSIKNLKEISWYLSIPVITIAYIIQSHSPDTSAFIEEIGFNLYWMELVSISFFKVTVALVFVLAGATFLGYLELKINFPILLGLATFLLTISILGIISHSGYINNIKSTYNIFWFIGLGSIAFNMYEIAKK
jgi:hypothetical protein